MAQQLKDLRNEGKREQAAALLEEQKATDRYKLANALRRHPEKSRLSFPEDMSSFEGKYQFNAPISNEASFYEFFPYISGAHGVGVGVGSDQMLDMLVNSRLERLVCTDISAISITTTRLLLEAGAYYHRTFNRYPTPEEYVALFDSEHRALLLEALQERFPVEDGEVLEGVLTSTIRSHKSEEHSGKLYEYLNFKLRQKDYASWLSTPENLQRTLSLYEQGKISTLRADVSETEANLARVAKELAAEGEEVSVIYLSNLREYLGETVRKEGLLKNIDAFPISDNTLLLETSVARNLPTIECPRSVLDDEWVAGHMYTWTYLVQTMGDFQAEQAGSFKDKKKMPYASLVERIESFKGRVDDRRNAARVGVVAEKEGLYTAGVTKPKAPFRLFR